MAGFCRPATRVEVFEAPWGLSGTTAVQVYADNGVNARCDQSAPSPRSFPNKPNACLNDSIYPVLTYKESQYPGVWSNIATGMNNGAPSRLSRIWSDTTRYTQNRNTTTRLCNALGTAPTDPQGRPYDCDEYGFASTAQGLYNTPGNVKYVPLVQNRGAGGVLVALYNRDRVIGGGNGNINGGNRFYIRTVDSVSVSSSVPAHPVEVVIDDTMMPDFGTMFINGLANPMGGQPLPYDEDVLAADLDVYVGPHFITLAVLGSRPLMRLEWWNAEPHHDDQINWPDPWRQVAEGSIDVPDGYVTASFPTLGLEGPCKLTVPVPHPEFKVLVAHHYDRETEAWMVQFWPGAEQSPVDGSRS